jgi:hypothetical protein
LARGEPLDIIPKWRRFKEQSTLSGNQNIPFGVSEDIVKEFEAEDCISSKSYKSQLMDAQDVFTKFDVATVQCQNHTTLGTSLPIVTARYPKI